MATLSGGHGSRKVGPAATSSIGISQAVSRRSSGIMGRSASSGNLQWPAADPKSSPTWATRGKLVVYQNTRSSHAVNALITNPSSAGGTMTSKAFVGGGEGEVSTLSGSGSIRRLGGKMKAGGAAIDVKILPTWATRGKEESPKLHCKALETLERELKEFPFLGSRRLPQSELNTSLILVCADVSRIKAGGIVCAFEPRRPTGVVKTLHNLAGPALSRELGTLSCPIGGVVATNSYNLPAENILHAGVPQKPGEDALQACYAAVFDEVEKSGLRSVAFTPLGKGEGYSFNRVQATHIALNATREWLEKVGHNLPPSTRIIHCCEDEDELQVYLRLAPHYFPVHNDEVGKTKHGLKPHLTQRLAAMSRAKFGIHEGTAKKRLDQAFYEFDKNGNLTLSKAEMSNVFEMLVPNLSAMDLDEVFSSVDTDNNGYIDYEEFCAWLHQS